MTKSNDFEINKGDYEIGRKEDLNFAENPKSSGGRMKREREEEGFSQEFIYTDAKGIRYRFSSFRLFTRTD